MDININWIFNTLKNTYNSLTIYEKLYIVGFIILYFIVIKLLKKIS